MSTKNVMVTAKNTKDEMLRFLEAIKSVIKDTAVLKNIQDTLDNASHLKKSEVLSTVEQAQSILMPTIPEVADDALTIPEVADDAPTENEVKTTKKKPTVKKTVENAVKPKATKTAKAKTSETKDSVVQTAEQIGMLPVAKVFPEELKVENLGTLKRADDSYKTMEDVAKALESGKQFYFACYWTPRQIKEYQYSVTNVVNPIKQFPNDLDILEPVYFCENLKRMWANSVYSEAMFWFDNEDIQHIEDTNPYTDEKFRVRVSSGMEFELYELSTED